MVMMTMESIVSSILVLVLTGCAQPTPLSLGTFLLADGDIFERMDAGIDARVYRPMKLNPTTPLVGPEYPWEGSMHMYGAVVSLNATHIRIYYACGVKDSRVPGMADAGSATCVAVSTDSGLSFSKPMLPIISDSNYSKTNMIFKTGSGWFDSMLLLPEHLPTPQGVPNGTRFVMTYDDGTTDSVERAMQLAVSQDGFSFTRLEGPPPPLPESFADTSVSLSYDPVTEEFIAFGRMDGAPNQHPGIRCGNYSPSFNMQSVRGVRRAASNGYGSGPTLANFTLSGALPFAFDKLDPQCLDVYNTAAIIVSTELSEPTIKVGTERSYLAFPSVFLHYGEEENNGILDVRFAFSRNGTKFRYINNDRRAFVPRGFGAGESLASKGLKPSLFDRDDDQVPAQWDSGLTYMYRGLVDHSDGTQSLYYFGQQGSHARQASTDRGQFGIGRVSIIRDRWVGLGIDSPFATASSNGSAVSVNMTTIPVMLPQCTEPNMLWLTVNAEVSVGGNLTMAILDATNGSAIEGFGHGDCVPVYGNRLGAAIRYSRGPMGVNTSNLTSFSRKPVQLDFRLQPPVRIFAWKFHCGPVS